MADWHQRHLYVAVQTLSAWSAIDVFVVSVFCGIYQLPRLTSFVVGDRCDAVNSFLALSPINQEPALQHAMTCFTVETAPKLGFVLLITAAVFSNVLGWAMLRSCSEALGFCSNASDHGVAAPERCVGAALDDA